MLTERGFDEALRISDVPAAEKESLPIKSYEVQKVVNKLVAASRPENYQPFGKTRKLVKTTRETGLRLRGFRQAVIEVYDFRCAVCGLKINSPDSLCWKWRRRILFLTDRSVGMTFSMESRCADFIIGHSTSGGLRCSMTTKFRSRPSSPNCPPISVAWAIMSLFAR
jgi:hypothetical protein